MRSALTVALVVIPAVAHAHIRLTSPTARATNDLQKEQHCGLMSKTRDPANVTTFAPGATITVTWQETINHPGWFRIAFQPSGEVFPIPPASNGPTGNGTASNFPTEDRTGMTDSATGAIVLADRIPDGTLSKQVTLPNMPCSNCTLQFIQVMTDKAPYTTDLASDDIYFNCADITLATSAPDAGTMITGDAATGGDAGSDPSKVSGGCQAGAGGGLPAALALLGLVGLRRRSRR